MKKYYTLITYHYDGTKQTIKLPINIDYRDFIDCSVVRWVLR